MDDVVSNHVAVVSIASQAELPAFHLPTHADFLEHPNIYIRGEPHSFLSHICAIYPFDSAQWPRRRLSRRLNRLPAQAS